MPDCGFTTTVSNYTSVPADLQNEFGGKCENLGSGRRQGRGHYRMAFAIMSDGFRSAT